MPKIPGKTLLHWMAAGCTVAAASAARTGPPPARSIASVEISMARDTPPAGTQDRPSDSSKGPRVSSVEYEGWRQYSVQCARCHGQDVLPNPVAANLLVSLAAGGAIDSPEKFAQVVREGRPHRGMPSFKKTVTPVQIRAIYAYVKGRADKRIPPGRPAKPSG
jgi:mono/diheme cytochrome c family protein